MFHSDYTSVVIYNNSVCLFVFALFFKHRLSIRIFVPILDGTWGSPGGGVLISYSCPDVYSKKMTKI